MQVDAADSHSISAVNGQNVRAVKRSASEELDAAPATKRIEGNDIRLEEAYVKPQIAKRVVPFPEKVCGHLGTSNH